MVAMEREENVLNNLCMRVIVTDALTMLGT